MSAMLHNRGITGLSSDPQPSRMAMSIKVVSPFGRCSSGGACHRNRQRPLAYPSVHPQLHNATVAGGPPVSPSFSNTPSTSHVETSGSIACSRPDRDASGIVVMAKTEKIDPVWDDLDR
jgi:hypothetical protein